MTNDQMADTHAKLTQLAELSLSVENLDGYIERVRNAPTDEHIDLALVVAGLQQVAHRLFTDDAISA